MRPKNYIEYKEGDLIGECIYLHEIETPKNRMRKAMFKCPQPGCDNSFKATISDIKRGHTKSCGCFHRTMLANKMTKHGLRCHKLYMRWNEIKTRCYLSTNKHYKNYGGRGIIMCDEWLNDFKSFYDHVTQLPNYGEPNMTLDREENDGNYEPGNVRWATRHVQGANKRMYKNNKYGYTGIYKSGKKWRAYICNGKQYNLGSYDKKEEAVQARNNYIIDNELFEYPIQQI